MTAEPFISLTISIGFEHDRAIALVGGEVDVLTARTLGAALRALVDDSDVDLVLDLSALEFIDAAGLRMITRTSSHMAPSGRVLTLRATPPFARRLLELAGMDEIVHFESSDANEARPV